MEDDDSAPRASHGDESASEGGDRAVGDREDDDRRAGYGLLDPGHAAKPPPAAGQGRRSGWAAGRDRDPGSAGSRESTRKRAREAAGAHDGDGGSGGAHAPIRSASTSATTSSGSGAENDIGSPVTGWVKASLVAWRASRGNEV